MSMMTKRDYTSWVIIAILIVIIVALIYRQQDGTASEPPSGMLAPNDPSIVLIDAPQIYTLGQYTLKTLATFSATARVLNVRHYYDDREAELSTVDFALGWGRMSDSAVLRSYEITQSNRWYFWHRGDNPPVSDDYVITHSRNVHIISSSKDVAKIVNEVIKNNVIQVSGYLVAVTANDGYHWISYLSLQGEGAHTCLVLLVTDITINSKG